MKRIIIIGLVLLAVLPIGYFVLDNILFDGIRPRKIDTNGLQANFFASDSIIDKPAIILIGGGQWGDYWGQLFAKSGYVGLSLPYYRQKGLPDLMEEIPLEYFEKAINWLSEQPAVNSDKVILMGASRNAELSLLIAATYPHLVHGAIAFSPSAVSWSNTVLPFNSDVIKPSWTYKNEPIPFIAMEKIKGGNSLTIQTLEYWSHALMDSIQVLKSSIKVEKINGPIILFSGKNDLVWPSALMSNMIEKRLKERDFKFDFKNIQYENTGHLISGNPNAISTERTGRMTVNGQNYEFEYGGTMEGDQKAQIDARKRIFEFISSL
jgi:dienelactone hydrolase